MDQQTKTLVNQIAEETAKKAVNQTLISLGIDANNQIDVQKDMMALRELRDLLDDPEIQQDLLHIRKWRKAADAVQFKGFKAAVSFIVLGILGLAWYGFKTTFMPQ